MVSMHQNGLGARVGVLPFRGEEINTEKEINTEHRVVEPQEGLGYKGPQRPSHSIPCYGQGRLSLDQVAQCPVQPGCGDLQEWGVHNVSLLSFVSMALPRFTFREKYFSKPGICITTIL